MSLKVKRLKQKFLLNYSRVIAKTHIPSGGATRIKKVIDRVLSLEPKQAEKILDKIIVDFSGRHKYLYSILNKNFNEIAEYIPKKAILTDTQRLLLGAYFTLEYSVEAAALFNPSIIPHPDQTNLPDGSLRFIMSFRSVGEGHISSIEFRVGVVDKNINFTFEPVSRFVERAETVENPKYNKKAFYIKLLEMQEDTDVAKKIFAHLGDEFSFSELEAVIKVLGKEKNCETVENMMWLARSNYQLHFSLDQKLSERIIFPASQTDSNGIEDARFVRFVDDDGFITYYATYTAYNGRKILPMILETRDFLNFKMITLNGEAATGKGMSLFPRKIKGKYAVISRHDGENLYIMYSDSIYYWKAPILLKTPEYYWEFIQIGNSGPPVETERGWIVLTHGVGPMRKYSLGAIVLDLEDPTKVVGYLEEPLLVPNKKEREGYVPNVVYSCGTLIHNGELIVPYAMSDTASGIFTVSVEDLFNHMTWRDNE